MTTADARSPLTVCILTAGRGTRMGAYGEGLNKALLPIDKKAIISHIIEKFPADTEFVIAVGHKAAQVQSYLSMVHPKTRFRFAVVDRYEGEGSGPGYSLLCSQQYLQKPFFFVACDTLWVGEPRLPTDCDWFGVAEVPEEESSRYCNFEIDTSERIVAIRDKERVSGERFKAFVGLCFVKSYERFWDSLSGGSLVAGERQVSNGIKALVATKSARAVQVQWIDTGDREKYERAVCQFENFNFSKPNESLYIVNSTVIKFFADEMIAAQRVQRARGKPEVFPAVTDSKEGFYSYPLVAGHTLYQHCTPALFRRFLAWLHEALWTPVRAGDVSRESITQRCTDFYRTKTLARVAAFQKKYPRADTIATVNEEGVPPVAELLARVPWEELCKSDPVYFHGDLQFDNVIFSPDTDRFTLLDWRQDFGGEVRFGDRYYDLGKLLGGLILNYDFIKQDLFDYQESSSGVTIDFAQRTQGARYEQILQQYVTEHGFDWSRVRLLVPIIFLNMSPLHHHPFDTFLFALGKLRLQQELIRIGR